jgi:hypothetical protein
MTHEGDEEEQSKGFVVIDRRGVDDEEEEETSAPSGASAAPEAEASEAPWRDEAKISEIDFSTLVHSFAISALFHMGAAPPEPDAPEAAPEINLPVARQNIDILEILEQKTRGNLSDEERHLLEGVLYEVRMRFVEASKGA